MKQWSLKPRMFPGAATSPVDGEPSYDAKALRILNEFAVDVMSIPNTTDLLWYVAHNVVAKLNFVDCVIYRSNPEETTLTQAAAMGEKNPFGRTIINPLVIPFGQGITGRVAQTREAVIVDDLQKNQDYIADTRPARSEICVPIMFGDRVVGVIDSEHPEPGAFGQSELDILTTVAAMTSAKLELLEEVERSVRRYHDLVQSHAQLTEEISRRKALEAELFEARRLKAIGKLSGGFAHDFNNLLTVISGNLEFLDELIGKCHPDVVECVSAAQTAAQKGAGLVRSMLAFSQKARLVPERVDLGALARSTLKLSERILPNTIEVNLNLSEHALPTEVDRDAAENALLNLIVNARDAMPDGGRITLRTEDVTVALCGPNPLTLQIEPGRYTRVSVEDTGSGIPEGHLQQIFDPFFTTKPVGQGTGLGLSTVFGFMQQSSGAVSVESEAGKGSTFYLYFPTASYG